mmetsp:Transcript_11390/g.24015  ORF Transcript_11390/g.24015 Transcript_11390/m.24015 type:complete len:214 (-) Transcript_11390:2155-2796(-)
MGMIENAQKVRFGGHIHGRLEEFLKVVLDDFGTDDFDGVSCTSARGGGMVRDKLLVLMERRGNGCRFVLAHIVAGVGKDDDAPIASIFATCVARFRGALLAGRVFELAVIIMAMFVLIVLPRFRMVMVQVIQIDHVGKSRTIDEHHAIIRLIRFRQKRRVDIPIVHSRILPRESNVLLVRNGVISLLAGFAVPPSLEGKVPRYMSGVRISTDG